MADESSQQVTVTGASGFIALHCIRLLLTEGYRVHGTVRRAEQERAVRAALEHSRGTADRLEVRVADLGADEGWDRAMAGSTFVLHVASPVPVRQPANPDDVIVPARDGTLRVLRAAAAAGVRRVVVTSSVAAIASGLPRIPGRVYTEEDWSDLQAPMSPYSRAKTLAERAAWDFVASRPAHARFELVAVNPSYVLGPSLGGTDNSSNEVVRKVLDHEIPGLPRLMLPVVDVRDVARAHLLAMTHQAAAGERFIVSEGDYWYAEMMAVLSEAGFDVTRRVVPNWLVRVVGWFDPTVRSIVNELGRERHVSSDKARRMLGWTTRSLPETMIDTARDIVQRCARR